MNKVQYHHIRYNRGTNWPCIDPLPFKERSWPGMPTVRGRLCGCAVEGSEEVSCGSGVGSMVTLTGEGMKLSTTGRSCAASTKSKSVRHSRSVGINNKERH